MLMFFLRSKPVQYIYIYVGVVPTQHAGSLCVYICVC